jgi:multidrug efflux system membrane fusion protein
LSEQANATVVPAHSIVTTQQGSYVYVVKANDTVEQRTVVPNRTIDNETVVDKGLQPGEIIVTDGQVNLVPGAKVEAKNSGTEPMLDPANRPGETTGSAAQQGSAADPPGDANRPKRQ